MKMDAKMWNVVLFNLCEAHGDLRALCAVTAYLAEGRTKPEWEEFIEGKARKRGFSPGWFEVTMEHVYHHVNYAWNCRHAAAERAIRCSDRDFNRWEKFPKDWPDLWPSPEQWEGKWPKERWAEHGWRTVRAAAMRPEFEAAEDALGLLIDGVFLRLGDDLDPMRRRPEKLREDAWAVTEQDFGVLIRRFYDHFNAAWNARRCRKAPAGKRRSCLFPREITRFWPENGMLPKIRKGALRAVTSEGSRRVRRVRRGAGRGGGAKSAENAKEEKELENKRIGSRLRRSRGGRHGGKERGKRKEIAGGMAHAETRRTRREEEEK